jgi:catalase
LRSVPEPLNGDKRRIRSESFADHYSQARQFFLSQTPVERQHIIDAFTFELSKVERPDIRERMVAGLLNVDRDLGLGVATGLGLTALPDPLPPARAPIDLDPSPALSILLNGPDSFSGRRIGALITDGVDAKALKALKQAAAREGAQLLLVAPTVGGNTDSDGNELVVDEKLDGAPSVLFDAIALLPTEEAAKQLSSSPVAIQFVADAHAHAKFIGWTAPALPLIAAALPEDVRDGGWVELKGTRPSATTFVETCRTLRYWDRDPTQLA